MERASGAAWISFARAGVRDLYQKAPCRILFPAPEEGDPVTAVLLTTSGGLTGGDRLEIKVDVGEGADCVLTTQAAEKIYRSLGDDCSIDVRLSIAARACAEWLMQETILFDGARLRRRTEADVAHDGRLLAVESIVFGRQAMGEDFRFGLIFDSWRIKREGRLIWADSMRLDGDVGEQRRAPFGFGEAQGCATVIYVGQDAGAHVELARCAVAEAGVTGGATLIDGVLIARMLADDAALLRRTVARVVPALRAAIAGRPAHMPRVWSM